MTAWSAWRTDLVFLDVESLDIGYISGRCSFQNAVPFIFFLFFSFFGFRVALILYLAVNFVQ